MLGRLPIMILVAAIVSGLDQLTKWWLVSELALGREVVVTSWLNLVHWRNPGIAFSMLSNDGADWLILAGTAVGMAVLCWWSLRHGPDSLHGRFGLSLAMGGAAGNFIDRVRLGEVVDFIDVHIGTLHWPAFNVADSALTVGFGLLILAWLTMPDKSLK